MKKMLITGARGLVGSACVRYFKSKYEVHDSGAYNLEDIEQTREVFRIVEPELVIHCAAKVGGVKANKTHPVEFLSQNLQMQLNVINQAANRGVEKLVFIGTSCMFPKDAALPVTEESLFTGKLEDSVEAYAIAKIAGWRLCKAYFEQYGCRFITVNPSNIYGPNDNYGPDAHVIPSLIRKMETARQTGEPVVVWGDGSAVREFIYSDDVAAAIDVAIEKWDSPEVLNIGSGESTTIKQVVDTLYNIIALGSGSKIQWDTTQPVGIPRKTFDVSKLTSLGWEPEVALRDGLLRAHYDYIKNPNTRK